MTTATATVAEPAAKEPTKRATKKADDKPSEKPADRPAEQPATAHKSLDFAILAVMEECPYIQKTGKMKGGGMNYTFASESDVIARLHPLMRKNRIVMVPSKVEMLYHETYPSNNGNMMGRVCLKVTYRVTHVDSASTCVVEAAAEGCDFGDKAAAKAMTNAHKYALRQLFNIETGDDPDASPSTEQAQVAPAASTNGHAEPAKARPTMTADESFRACQDALKRAPSRKLLDQYRSAYLKRSYTADQRKTLDGLYEENCNRFAQTT